MIYKYFTNFSTYYYKRRSDIIMKIRKKENEGITLIALVITIIILLILAGVSIAMLTRIKWIINPSSRSKSKNRRSRN